MGFMNVHPLKIWYLIDFDPSLFHQTWSSPSTKLVNMVTNGD